MDRFYLILMFKIFLFLYFFISTVYAQNLSWYFKYDEALITAQNENKELFILLVDNNQNSKNLLNALNEDKKLIKSLNKRFINVLINVNYKTTYPIELYYTTKFPTIFIANAKLELVLNEPIYDIEVLKVILTLLPI